MALKVFWRVIVLVYVCSQKAFLLTAEKISLSFIKISQWEEILGKKKCLGKVKCLGGTGKKKDNFSSMIDDDPFTKRQGSVCGTDSEVTLMRMSMDNSPSLLCTVTKSHIHYTTHKHTQTHNRSRHVFSGLSLCTCGVGSKGQKLPKDLHH